MEVPTATWSVVQFVEDKSVEAVPTNWLDGDKCYWSPLRKAKLNNAIRKLETPQPTWIKFTVKSFRNGIFNDYSKARKKAKEAEETSDLQSEVDKSGVPRKRKIYRPLWATSSEDLSCDETMLTTPPSLGRILKIVTATSEESPSFVKRPFEKRQAEEEPQIFSTIGYALSALQTDLQVLPIRVRARPNVRRTAQIRVCAMVSSDSVSIAVMTPSYEAGKVINKWDTLSVSSNLAPAVKCSEINSSNIVKCFIKDVPLFNFKFNNFFS